MTLSTIFGLSGLSLTAEERSFFQDSDPWGFILFARNVERPAQLSRLTSDIRDAMGRNVPILIDQEGGRVERLGRPHWKHWMPPLTEAGHGHPRSFYLRYAVIAAELRAVGIDVNCAPCCDIASDATHPFLRNRCLGTSADEVIPNVRAAIEGHFAGGCLPVVKHAPGHGRSRTDSHIGLPVVEASIPDLLQSDFKVFRDVSDAIAVMSAHVVYPELDADHPATLSHPVISFLRDTLKMDGLIMTDDLSMGALGGTLAERTHAALAAGCDIALHCNGKMEEMAEVAATARPLSGASLKRADLALARRPTAPSIDPEAILAEYDDLISGKA